VIEIELPHLGEGIDEVELALWHVDEGAEVSKDSDLCEVTTDKVSFNIPAPEQGVVEKKLYQEGQKVKVGDIIILLR